MQYDGHTYHHVLETGGQLDRELNHISSGSHHHSLLWCTYQPTQHTCNTAYCRIH